MLGEPYQYTVHDARYTEQCEFFFLLQKLIFQVRVYIEYKQKRTSHGTVHLTIC